MSFNGTWHVEKGPQYDQDEAKAWYELVICLDDFDQEFAAEFSSTKEKFDNLRLKYNKTCPIDNRENLAKLTAFKLEEGVSLEEAWVQIKSLRTKVVNAQPSLKSTFTEEYIFNILMSALPAKYATTIDAIDAQPHTLNAHKKLEKLQRKEECLKAANTDDTATLAKQFNKKRNAKPKGCKFSYGSDKDVEDSDNNGGDQKKGPNRGCYLCGGLHFYQDCKYGKEFMEFVKKEKREACRCAPACRSGQKTCGKKNKAYAADGNSGDDSSSSTSIASNNDSFDEEAQISRVDAKANKLVPRGRIGVFMGYSNSTDKHFKVYASDRGYTITSHVVDVDESKKGSSIDLRIRSSPTGQGTPNTLPDRIARGRPRKQPARPIAPTTPIALISPIALIPDEVEYEPPADPEQDLPADAPTVPINQPEEANENGGAEYYDEEGNKLQGETIVVDVPMADRNNGDASIDNPGTAEQESVDFTAQNDAKNNEHVPLPSSRPASTEPVLPAPPTQHLAQSAPPAQAPSPYFLQKRKRSDSTPKFDHQTHKLICAHIARLEIKEEMEEYEECMLAHFPGTNIPAPQSYQEAVSHPQYGKHWWKAIEAELHGLDGNQTFCEEIPPDGANCVSMKWVFTVKKNLDGTIERFKARLVARGFTQVYGEDFTETFAPTVRVDTLRLFLAIAAKEDQELQTIDIRNAFTESKLKERIYLIPAEGIKVRKGYMLRALRSLYGLKQAARDWNKLCTKTLIEAGFVQSLADPCLFVHHERNLSLLVYVDDMVVSGKLMSEVTWFKRFMASKFNIQDLKDTSKILGMRVTRN
ncbi:Reverse transcriptase, RNA-dependent DNA polymerase [Lasallia pustulata]|uniref:Reverse transcriptase, RNA-dependent DNA polymerase n=1 Tax=Lasallia pustulata TaxID=136370 RepID=A0A1W5DD61_9LECA|nr:Reverse transcriptase, RNA-dependent DNA polymerase [Lasallia pustulata]